MDREKAKLSGLNDEQLVFLSQSGNVDAYNVLADRMRSFALYFASVYDFSGRHLEDLAQEGMFGLMSAVKTYSQNKNAAFRTYACVCIRNAVKNAVGGLKYADLPSQAVAESFGLNPEDELIREETIERLYGFINKQLSDFERSVILLYLEGRTYREISLALSKSEKAVDNALTRVRRKLKNIF